MSADPLDRVTIDELKGYIDKQLDTDDALLETLLTSALEQVQQDPPHGCGRLLVPDPLPVGDPLEDTAAPVAKTLKAWRGRARVPDAREISAVTVAGRVLDPDDYETVEDQGYIVEIRLPRRFYATAAETAVTGRFGFLEIPTLLKDGIYILAARYFHERDAQYADAVVVGEGGSAPAYYKRFPQRTQLALQTYRAPADTVLVG